MSAATFIAGDWGTSHLRLALCDADGRVLDTRSGPGAAQARGRFAEEFATSTGDWRSNYGELPAVLCGMVGSNIGWVEAPYLDCPEELDDIPLELASAAPGVRIVPGMRCCNPLGAPDVMRGEETQLLGALALHDDLARGRKLLCLPGTHTKWVALHDGTVLEFLTAPTGELFSLLVENSVLVRTRDTPIVHVPSDFERGLEEARKHSHASLLHTLFQSRSLRIDKQLSAEGAASWTSGLLIGSDVAGALPLFADHDAGMDVFVIGTPHLTASYSAALAQKGRNPRVIDGAGASLAGLTRIHRALEDAGLKP